MTRYIEDKKESNSNEYERHLLRVLIVDDEPFVRQGLKALIDWELEGYTIEDTAENGKDALIYLTSKQYEVIISDIKMPEMDGMELLKYIKENQISQATFVFLSGYYEFSYARTAIQYGCSDYILKPVEREGLLSALRRVRELYDIKKNGNEAKEEYEKAYLDRNLMALIWGKYDAVNIHEVEENLRLSEYLKYIHVELFKKSEKYKEMTEESRRKMQRTLYYKTRWLLKEDADHVIFDVTKHADCYDIGIIYCTYMSFELGMSEDEWLNWLLEELSKQIGMEISACVGSRVKGIEFISESYREACMVRSLRFFEQQKKKAWYIFHNVVNNNHSPQEEYFRKEMDELVHVVEINDLDKITSCVKEIYRKMMESSLDSEMIGLNIQYLLYRLLGLAYELDANIDQDEVMQYIRDAAFSFDTFQGNESKLIQFAVEYARYLNQLRQSNSKGILLQVETEIAEHYAENISLKSLGEKFYVNSAYLGQIFKKQYGSTFKDYLNGIRIRKAAELLLRTDEKVYEIAQKVGYKNMDYFINKFESVYGQTPTRFRKRKQEGEWA